MAINELPEMRDLWQKTLNWHPNEEQQRQFQQFYELILTSNRQFNLTRIVEAQEFWEKHLWDSLRGIFPRVSQPDATLIDIGTGAGFPGVPIAIAIPTWRVTLLDSTRKKINFLQDSIAALELKTVQTLIDRVEQTGRTSKYRERFDFATIRAVASASICAEYALPLLKINGCAILYRGQWTPEEATLLNEAIAQLGGELETIDRFETPLTRSVRHCLYIRKIRTTPKEFPRAIGVPAQKPL